MEAVEEQQLNKSANLNYTNHQSSDRNDAKSVRKTKDENCETSSARSQCVTDANSGNDWVTASAKGSTKSTAKESLKQCEDNYDDFNDHINDGIEITKCQNVTSEHTEDTKSNCEISCDSEESKIIGESETVLVSTQTNKSINYTRTIDKYESKKGELNEDLSNESFACCSQNTISCHIDDLKQTSIGKDRTQDAPTKCGNYELTKTVLKMSVAEQQQTMTKSDIDCIQMYDSVKINRYHEFSDSHEHVKANGIEEVNYHEKPDDSETDILSTNKSETEFSSTKQTLQNEGILGISYTNKKNESTPNNETIHIIQKNDNLLHNSLSNLENGNFHKPQPQNDDSNLSTNSSASETSISSTSSQQLVIDHPMDDNETLKVAPLKLSLKRRSSKLNSELEPVSKHFISDVSFKRDKSTINGNEPKCNDIVEWQEQQPLKFSKSCTIEEENKVINIEKRFICRYCNNVTFDSMQFLKEHYNACAMNNSSRVPGAKMHKSPAFNAQYNNGINHKKRYYKCLFCKTVHEEWNFFNHIRDNHKRYICFYCYRLFPTAEKLTLHLENKHDMEQNHFNTAIDVCNKNESDCCFGRNLTCCMCQHVFQSNESYLQHNCNDFLQPCECCDQRGRHIYHCKINNQRKHTKKKIENDYAQSPTILVGEPPAASSIVNTENRLAVHYNDNDYINKTSNFELYGGIGSDCKNNSSDNVCNNGESNQTEKNKTITHSNEMEEYPIPKLIIPKIMLRVPKEFQKSVDAEVSSTESEDFDDEIDPEDRNSPTQPAVIEEQDREQSWSDVDTRSATETITEELSLEEPTKTKLTAVQTDSQNTDDESSDSTKANLKRILNEIERTKMEIKRTKDKALNKQEILSQSTCSLQVKSKGTTTEQRWSPTPPASPQSRCLSPRRKTDSSIATNTNKEFDSNLAKSIPLTYLQINDSKSSDVMDIDDIVHTVAYKYDGDHEERVSDEINQNIAETSMEINSENNPKDETTNENFNISVIEKGKDPELAASVMSEDILKTTSLPLAEDGIEIANEDTVVVELQLDRPIDKFEIVDFVRLCLKSVYPLCLYCNHARRIAVNARSLVLHMIAQHRFTGTVDSITAEELQIETIVAKLKSFLNPLEFQYLNSSSYCTLGNGTFTRPFNERIYECFQCRFVTSTHKELYMHNRRLHMKTAILCFMCRSNFYSFSEILCHICPGEPNKTSNFDIKYRCCLCETSNLPSPFRLMVHLRKKHFACDICLEDCRDQSKLSSHVWKHKLHHLCYRCGIAYRNKQDITKHLYWKHGTESISCKRCLQKRWRHVYHFCIPPSNFVCDECNLCFSKAMYLEVHKRSHTGDFRYPCTEDRCEEIFISRRFLLKHTAKHHIVQFPDLKGLQDVRDEETVPPVPDNKLVKIINENKISNTENVSYGKTKKKNEILKKEIDDINQTKESASFESDQSGQPNNEKQRKKQKKNKRSKELLEDLNLIAPNLSESDSCNESDTDNISKADDNVLHLPNVMLSPSSESDNEPTKHNIMKQENIAENTNTTYEGKMSDIWKNLLKANTNVTIMNKDALPANIEVADDFNLVDLSMPNPIHVCMSDHDYCKMYRTPLPPPPRPPQFQAKSLMPKLERKSAKNSGNNSTRKSDNLSSDSSTESSSSSDSSSCSCGSNCSCSSSDSESTSSSSPDVSDSSSASVNSRKRQRKKSVRKKSVSPQKQAHKLKIENTPTVENKNDGNDNISANAVNMEATTKLLPFNESDLETAESETDEEFYDEHPQKLANDLLAQKRAALLAQTRLSPSHNYDIVENSRPSTPSLPEEVSTFGEKRTKLKKKKRERKSSCKANQKISAHNDSVTLSTFTNPELLQSNIGTTACNLTSVQQPSLTTTATIFKHSQSLVDQVEMTLSTSERQSAPRQFPHLSMKHVSEGSSCSDADSTLKRSKRTRRPNKFYGYSSDDENLSTVLAPPLMVGMQLIKPQPPPQLTWAKEDLPAPSKSILNVKNKTPRLPKTPSTPQSTGFHNPGSGATSSRKERKRRHLSDEKLTRKSKKKFKDSAENSFSLPPIPTLKIRPSELLAVAAATNNSDVSSGSSSDEEEEVDVNVFTVPQATAYLQTIKSQFQTVKPHSALPIGNVLQITPSLPPVPETTAFNQKIPPALLPNPNFATLQYFKANNIRYPVRPPAGARLPREGEAVYCYCRCPYDEVSEMIACDGDNCLIEWFHFECVGIMVAPQGKWFCAECRPRYSEELYPSNKT